MQSGDWVVFWEEVQKYSKVKKKKKKMLMCWKLMWFYFTVEGIKEVTICFSTSKLSILKVIIFAGSLPVLL